MNNRYRQLMQYSNPARDIPLRVSYLFLQQTDLLLTLLAVSAGFTDLNPVMANLIHTPQDLLVFKIIVPVFIALLVPGKLLWPAVILLAFVVGWNLKEFLLILI